ncbi:MAG TPA: deoxyribose-phosphate aldolase [Bacteroidales bacterium]|nr:deoxyribose-phosphate aldolase [Bacteroidales bacterium]
MMSNTFSGKSNDDIKLLLSRLETGLNPTVTRKLIGLLDFTTLSVSDSFSSVNEVCDKINNYGYVFPDLPHIAAFCVYPRFVKTVRESMESRDIKIVSVAGSFPSSQAISEIKLEEVKRAAGDGADEIDIVMSVGEFLDGNHEFVKDEIMSVKDILGDKHLKVILETGVLKDPEKIYEASILAMEAGADFIKTSTGKEKVSATLEAVYVMCHAIRDFNNASGRVVGIKPAGGISTAIDAINYYSLVEMILGQQWLVPETFRIGASRLANNLLSEAEGRQVEYM